LFSCFSFSLDSSLRKESRAHLLFFRCSLSQNRSPPLTNDRPLLQTPHLRSTPCPMVLCPPPPPPPLMVPLSFSRPLLAQENTGPFLFTLLTVSQPPAFYSSLVGSRIALSPQTFRIYAPVLRHYVCPQALLKPFHQRFCWSLPSPLQLGRSASFQVISPRPCECAQPSAPYYSPLFRLISSIVPHSHHCFSFWI